MTLAHDLTPVPARPWMQCRLCGQTFAPEPSWPTNWTAGTICPRRVPAGEEKVRRPAWPPLRARLLLFAHALLAWALSGCRLVTSRQYRRRRAICGARCGPARRCPGCGCWLVVKARGAAWDCPEGHWPASGARASG